MSVLACRSGCTRPRGHVGNCSCSESLGSSRHQSTARFSPQESPNPWAAVSPDCPRGHHSRRVFRWSYDRADPLPWFCAECKRRFAG